MRVGNFLAFVIVFPLVAACSNEISLNDLTIEGGWKCFSESDPANDEPSSYFYSKDGTYLPVFGYQVMGERPFRYADGVLWLGPSDDGASYYRLKKIADGHFEMIPANKKGETHNLDPNNTGPKEICMTPGVFDRTPRGKALAKAEADAKAAEEAAQKAAAQVRARYSDTLHEGAVACTESYSFYKVDAIERSGQTLVAFPDDCEIINHDMGVNRVGGGGGGLVFVRNDSGNGAYVRTKDLTRN